MNILFTLCGRAGSKGFKNKNLKTFLAVPLVYYSIAEIKMFLGSVEGKRHDCDVVLNTDSEELIKIVRGQEAVAVEIIRRDASLGGDTIAKVDVIKDCLLQMEDRRSKRYDMVVDLDITSPLRTLQDLQNAISKKAERSETDVVFSVTDSRRNPYFNMVREENGFFCKAIASEYTARQQAPVFYDMNASIYAYSAEALKKKESKVFFNGKCDVVVMKDTGILDIDSEEDFELMQVVAKYLFSRDEKFAVLYQETQKVIEEKK